MIYDPMKPWRPYWKALERVMEVLMRNAKPPPFPSLDKTGEWILGLKFAELAMADMDCDSLIKGILSEEEMDLLEHGLPDGDLRWQLILRCECALDFCRGRVEKRKEFDWNQNPKTIYRWLLIEFWRRSAVHWSCRFGAPDVQAAVRQMRLQKEVTRLFRYRNIDPAKN